MRFFFSTYCFGAAHGQALIGVYKRGLRLANELCGRGHEVVFHCTGREAYHDTATRAAEARMTFVDVPFTVAGPDQIEENRRHFRAALRLGAPDCVVIGEAPLAGALLETTLTAVELGIPTVVIDNAYCGLQVEEFLDQFGSMVDAMVMMGPSCQHSNSHASHLCQLPPLGVSDPEGARILLEAEGAATGGSHAGRLVVVLAYDAKVEALGRALAPHLSDADTTVFFVARDPEGCRQRLDEQGFSEHDAIVVGQPPDAVLLGLLANAQLAVVKYGFMQVSECLCHQTPAIAMYHEGPRWTEFLPPLSRRFLHVADEPEASIENVARAQDLLRTEPDAMAEVHDGRADGLTRAADFLETVPRLGRSGFGADVDALGFAPSRVKQALLRRAHSRGQSAPVVAIHALRALRVRCPAEVELYLLLCHVELDGKSSWQRLWGLKYAHPIAALRDRMRLTKGRGQRSGSRPPRHRHYFSFVHGLSIEDDLGEYHLPRLNA